MLSPKAIARLQQESAAKSRFLSRIAMLNCFPGSMTTSSAKKSDPQLDFEAAMDRLEAIVDQMESGKMPLEELIVRYEEGMKLVKVCQERLASAEQRIEVITRNHAGKPVVKPFEPKAEAAPAAAPQQKGPTDHDEVSLF